jgi:DSBA-like thioredoxin domain protein
LGHAIQALASSGDIELRWQILTFLDDNLRNDSSSRAARAIAAADMVGKLAPYHNTVYANQPEEEGTGYTDEQLRDDFAAQAGIKGEDLATFQKYYDNNTTKDFAEKAAEEGLKEGMKLEKKFGTPFMTVDGKPWNDWTNLAEANQNQLLDAIKKAAK